MKKKLLATFSTLFLMPILSYAWTDKAYANCDQAVKQRVGQFQRLENRTRAFYPDTARSDPRFPGENYFVYTVVTNQGSFNNTKCYFNPNTDAVTRVELN
jgi:hypothetical protein